MSQNSNDRTRLDLNLIILDVEILNFWNNLQSSILFEQFSISKINVLKIDNVQILIFLNNMQYLTLFEQCWIFNSVRRMSHIQIN